MKRWGIWVLPLAGLLYVVGVLVRGEFAVPSASTATRFASITTAPTYCTAYMLIITAAALSVLGYIALCAVTTDRLRIVAMALSILGVQFLIPFFGAMVIVFPALGSAYSSGNVSAIDIASKAFESRYVAILAGLVSLNVIGHVLYSIVIWRTPRLPKAAILPFIAAPIMQSLPFLYPVEILGCVLFLVAGILIATAVQRSTDGTMA